MYHFGWQNADGTPAAGQAGKAIRPALVLAAARALGGDPEQAVRAAVAVELAHNFTLLHDDVIDEDTTLVTGGRFRAAECRGRPRGRPADQRRTAAWTCPCQFLVAGTLLATPRSAAGSLRPDVPALHLALHVGGAVYESARAEGDFSAALATVRRALPDDIRLQTCSDCAFSGSFPAPGRALSGTLACFRGAKDAYRGAAAGEGGVPDLWDRRSGTVQEIWSCREFEPGATEGTGADRREAVPLEHADPARP
ncbi:hypothetical protein SCALM49S_01652 [Streptomyces californicus]